MVDCQESGRNSTGKRTPFSSLQVNTVVKSYGARQSVTLSANRVVEPHINRDQRHDLPATLRSAARNSNPM
jgi:hypothetical protein